MLTKKRMRHDERLSRCRGNRSDVQGNVEVSGGEGRQGEAEK